MCGILGLIHNTKYAISTNDFKKINNLNYNRGPDFQNVKDMEILNHRIMIGHTRLSIQDLSVDSNQPMKSFSGRFIISFNGEIYNHLDLRRDLRNKNFNRWKTKSDTETLINLFEFYSFDEVLKIIEGMFSFILIDNKEKNIYFARDIGGEKPLYIHFNNLFIAASSDLNTIKTLPCFTKTINQIALENYLQYNYIPNPLTIFDNTFKLPPASYLKLNLLNLEYIKFKNFDLIKQNKSMTFKYWWSFKKKNSFFSKMNNLEIKNIIHDNLKKSVKSQLISDVPLGAFLSAGIDSSLIVSIMQQFNSNTKTFTIGYEDINYDESNQANKIAKYLSTDHTSYKFANSEVINFIKNTPTVYSEPFADSSQLPTLLVSKIAKERVKVVLTGDGGDELFGGYNRYIYANKYWRLLNIINPKLRNILLKNLIKYSPNNFYKIFNLIFDLNLNNHSLPKISDKLAKIRDEISYYDTMTKEWYELNILNNASKDNHINKKVIEIFKNYQTSFEEKMMLADFYTYMTDDILCKVDRATMSYSLESRAPYLNKNVIETSFNLPIKYKLNNGNSKIILREILSDYLPRDLINSKKMGFGVPIGELIRTDLKEWTKEILSESNCKRHDFFNYDILKNTLDNHINRNQNNQFKLWSIIQFNIWYENL